MALLRASNLPAASCSRDGPSPITGSVCKEYGLCCWGREEAGRVRFNRQRGKENKQSERESGYLGKLQTSYLTGSQGHDTTSLAHCPSCSWCHMAPNACLLLLHCHLSTFPPQLIKPQLPLCSPCEPLLSADTLILLEKFATFESNWSWQGGTDTLLLNCQQLTSLQ